MKIRKYVSQGLCYADIGRLLGLSRERVRQVAKKEKIDIKKLKKENPQKFSKKVYITSFCKNCGNKITYYSKGCLKGFFCSRECLAAFYRKALGKKKTGRYIKGVRQYRQIMENYVGRKLTPSEVVHHVNGNPSDNRIENLKIMQKKAHQELHGRINSKTRREALDRELFAIY